MFRATLGNVACAIDVRLPQECFVLHCVRKNGRTVDHTVKMVLLKKAVEEVYVTNISLDCGEEGIGKIIFLQVDTHTFPASFHQLALQNAAKKACAAGQKNRLFSAVFSAHRASIP